MVWGIRGLLRRGRRPPEARSFDGSSRSLGSALRGRPRSRRRSLDHPRAGDGGAARVIAGAGGGGGEGSIGGGGRVVGSGGGSGGGGAGRGGGAEDDAEDDDDDDFSNPSTHPSRDPFLNDSSSIPASSVGPARAAARGADDDDEEFEFDRRMRQDPFLAPADVVDMDHDLLARARSRNRDRARERDLELRRNLSQNPGRPAQRNLERNSSLPRLGGGRSDWPRVAQGNLSADRTAADLRTSVQSSGSGTGREGHFVAGSGSGPVGFMIAGSGAGGASASSAQGPPLAAGPCSHARGCGGGMRAGGSSRNLLEDGSFGSLAGGTATAAAGAWSGQGRGLVPPNWSSLLPGSKSFPGSDDSDMHPMTTFGGALELPPQRSVGPTGSLPTPSNREGISTNSTTRSASTTRRRASFWKRQTDHQPTEGQSEHQRQILVAIALSDSAIHDANSAAAEKLVSVVEGQLSAFDAAIVANRAKVSRLRASITALPSTRSKEYEDALYVKSGRWTDDEEAEKTRNEAEAVFHEFRIMEGVWEIEAAIAEKRWRDAVILVEEVRADTAAATVGDRCRKKGFASGAQPKVSALSDGIVLFDAARAELDALVCRIAGELRSLCSSGTGVDSWEYAPLLVQLGLPNDARRAVFLAGSSALVDELDVAKSILFADSKYHKYVSTVTARTFAQICESYALFCEVSEMDAIASSNFVSWAVAQIDETYNAYLAPCLHPDRVSLFQIASIVMPMRKSTLCVPSEPMFEEIGMLWDSRLASLLRLDIGDSLSKYHVEFCARAEKAGSMPVESWVGSPLSSWEPIGVELVEYTKNAALSLLGLDNGLDAMIASVMTSVCGTYAACLLDVFVLSCSTAGSAGGDDARDGGGDAQVGRVIRETMEAVGKALASVAKLDHVLHANAGVSWMTGQLRQGGGRCGPERLRGVIQPSLDARGLRGLAVPVSSLPVVAEDKARGPPDPTLVRETVREVFGRQQHFLNAVR
jgi:hypothetical protein